MVHDRARSQVGERRAQIGIPQARRHQGRQTLIHRIIAKLRRKPERIIPTVPANVR